MTDHTTPPCHFEDHDCFLLGHECKCCIYNPTNHSSRIAWLVSGMLLMLGMIWVLVWVS